MLHKISGTTSCLSPAQRKTQQHDWRSISLLTAFHFPLSRKGMTHQKVPPPGREQLRDPAAKPPAGISEHLSPPRLAFHTVQGQHRCFSKPAPVPGGVITAASWAHLPQQHLGGQSHFLSGSLQEGNSCLATVTKNLSSSIMSW